MGNCGKGIAYVVKNSSRAFGDVAGVLSESRENIEDPHESVQHDNVVAKLATRCEATLIRRS